MALTQEQNERIARILLQYPPEEREATLIALQDTISGQGYISRALVEADYEETPPTIQQFLDDDNYLGKLGVSVYPCWRKDLEYIFSPSRNIYEVILKGSIGTGKSTTAVIALVYKAACLACMRNPQEFYDLSPNSPIVFGFFNIFKYLAADVGFSYFNTVMTASPFFKRISKKNRDGDAIGLPKNINFVIGAQAMHAIGQNLFGGLIDEASFGKAKSQSDRDKSQMQDLYMHTRDRITSRFLTASGKTPGLLILASSERDKTDFLAKHIEKVQNNPGVYVAGYALWEAKTKLQTGKWFYVFAGDERRDPKVLKNEEVVQYSKDRVVRVPDTQMFRDRFSYDLPNALRNLAGVSTFGSFKLITNRQLFFDCMNRATPREHPFSTVIPAIGLMAKPRLIDYVDKSKIMTLVDKTHHIWVPKFFPNAKRILAGDLSSTGDCTGLAMGCISKVTRTKNKDVEEQEYTSINVSIWIDFVLRVAALPGSRIDYEQIRELIFFFNSCKFPLHMVTFDSFQSEDTIQILTKAGITAKVVSVDKTRAPYDMLKACCLEGRLDIYDYPPFVDEILNLNDNGSRGIDHPDDIGASKDVADALASVVWNLMTQKATEMSAENASPDAVFGQVDVGPREKGVGEDFLSLAMLAGKQRPTQQETLSELFGDEGQDE